LFHNWKSISVILQKTKKPTLFGARYSLTA